MRAAITSGIRKMEVVEAPDPPDPGPGELIVRPRAVGICGSDFHFYLGELDIFEGSPFPRVQGHEVGATIEALGPGCDERLQAGGGVALHPLSSCGHCYPCSVGRGNVCDNFSLIGIHEDGGLQELLRMPEAHVFPIEADEPGVAALAEPLSIGVRAVRRAGIREGERVVVLGAGPIGQAVQMVARDHGATVLLIDPLPGRVELSVEMGAEAIAWTKPDEVVAAAREWAGGEGAPVVFDATGAPGAIRAAVEIAASAGRVVVVGMSGEEVPLAVMTFTEKELDVLGVSCCGEEEFAEAVDLVERNSGVLERMISHRFPLERAPEALEYAMENPTEVMKVVIGGD